MLTFPIAIGPYHKHVGRPAFVQEVSLDRLRVGRYLGLNWSIEEREGVAGVPFSVVVTEVMRGEVAGYRGDGEGGIGLGVCEVEIFDILICRGALKKCGWRRRRRNEGKEAHCLELTSRKNSTD